MKLSKKQIIIVAAGALVLIGIFGLVFSNLQGGNKKGITFTIKVWGTDPRGALEPFMTAYKGAHPLGTVEYTQFDPKNYEQQLLEAFASGSGPDLFYIGNRELPKQKARIVPIDPVQFPGFNLAWFEGIFPRAAEDDFTSGGQIYAVPLYMDTMALLYNKDLFDQAGVVAPPKTWDEFLNDVKKLRLVNPQGQITRAAAAVGGTEKTVDAGVDLLHLLMLQNGVKMVNPDLSAATFATGDTSEHDSGNAAFNFYLQFANAGSPYYTWNEGQANSIDSFASGKTAMIINYRSVLETIKNKGPFLNIGIAPVPQTSADFSLAYPRYQGLAVSKQSQNPYWAWDFASFVATNAENGRIYFNETGAPPALKQLIEEKLNDPEYAVFARQALTARTWYEANDTKINTFFDDAIQSVLYGQADARMALHQAQDSVSQLMTNK
jgi:multiple sugar transport system substrate-binding protein